jgi:hypothetical protein
MNCEVWQTFLPHSPQVLRGSDGQNMEGSPEILLLVVMCPLEDGWTREAVLRAGECCRWNETQYPEGHSSQESSSKITLCPTSIYVHTR